MNAKERIEELEAERREINDKICMWEMVMEAKEQESNPRRDRVVIESCGDYIATHRYEINDTNGFCNVQLHDGSLLCCQLGTWSLFGYACDHFEISHGDIKFDVPQTAET